MKHFSQFLAVLFLLMLVGCATSGSSGGSSSSSTDSSNGKQLTADDYKRLGIQETGNTVR